MLTEELGPTERPINVLVILGHPRAERQGRRLQQGRIFWMERLRHKTGAWLVVPHAALLTWLLYRHIRSDRAAGRIDGLMVASLGYVVWFGLVPLLRLALL